MKLLQELDELSGISSALQQIGVDCSSFVNHPVTIYRGIQRPSNNPIQRIRIRNDRAPLDTRHLASAMFNYQFERLHGERNVRMRALFGTRSKKQAAGYGVLHWVFPTNECTIWADAGRVDSMRLVDKWLASLVDTIPTADIQAAINDSGVHQYDGDIFAHISEYGSTEGKQALASAGVQANEWLGKYTKITPESAASIPDQTELMVVGPAYYAINVSWAEEHWGIPYEDMAFQQVLKSIKTPAP